jgi:hypothetical protein
VIGTVFISVNAGFESVIRLPGQPWLGAGRVDGTRELIVTRTLYIVPYRVRGGVLEVLAVIRFAREWPDRQYIPVLGGVIHSVHASGRIGSSDHRETPAPQAGDPDNAGYGCSWSCSCLGGAPDWLDLAAYISQSSCKVQS